MTDGFKDKRLEEFIGETQELTEALSGSLMNLHKTLQAGQNPDPGDINGAFRAIHTVKGLSSLFGIDEMAALAHDLEEICDDLRMGRIQLDGDYLDLLFQAVDIFQAILTSMAEKTSLPAQEVESFIDKLRKKSGAGPCLSEPLSQNPEIDPEVLAVLTEYEEYRLKESMDKGKNLFFVSASFPVDNIEKDLETLKELLQKHGEIITYLPSNQAEDENSIDLDILVATDESIEKISQTANLSHPENKIVDVLKKPIPASNARNELWAEFEETQKTQELSHLSLRSLTQTVRVDIRKLDNLMNLLGEINVLFGRINEIAGKQSVQSNSSGLEFARVFRLVKRRLDELRDGILDVRMVPLEQLFDKLSRIVRKMSREGEKPVEFFVTGADTELDKLIVEELSDPLMHIIRNCMDHGIEPAEERRRKAKRAEGLIALRAYQKGNHVIIEVEDDGTGISKEKVISTALSKGIIDDKQTHEMSDREVLNLIFKPGFSTRQWAGTNSGRGVGMDVVKTNLAKLSGLIDIQSRENIGTKFILTLPITLAIIRALIVRVSDQLYAVPLNSVLEALAIYKNQISTIEGKEVISVRGSTFPLLRLSQLFGIPEKENPNRLFVVVVGMAQHRVGLVVNELKSRRDIVIKPLGKVLSSTPGIAGATELDTQNIVLVLDIASLVDDNIVAPEANKLG